MKVLFLDDQESRHRVAAFWCKGMDHCYGYGDCVQLLMLNHYDVVSLDHDLGGPLLGPSKERTGVDVARFIVSLPHKPSVAIIHSFNLSGAAEMAAILTRAGVRTFKVPFGFDPSIYKQLNKDVTDKNA